MDYAKNINIRAIKRRRCFPGRTWLLVANSITFTTLWKCHYRSATHLRTFSSFISTIFNKYFANRHLLKDIYFKKDETGKNL